MKEEGLKEERREKKSRDDNKERIIESVITLILDGKAAKPSWSRTRETPLSGDGRGIR